MFLRNSQSHLFISYLKVNGTYILKSGTDFRQFSTITLDFSQELLQVDIESVDVTSEYEPDNELSSLLEQFTGNGKSLKCLYSNTIRSDIPFLPIFFFINFKVKWKEKCAKSLESLRLIWMAVSVR